MVTAAHAARCAQIPLGRQGAYVAIPARVARLRLTGTWMLLQPGGKVRNSAFMRLREGPQTTPGA